MKTDTSVVFSLLLSLFYTVIQSPYPYWDHCIPTVSPLYPHCISTVSLLYPFCILTVSSLYPNCILTVSLLYPHCIPTVSLLYTHCILTVSPLYPHYPHYIQIYPVLHCDQTVRNPPMGVLAMKSIHRKTTFISIYLRNKM